MLTRRQQFTCNRNFATDAEPDEEDAEPKVCKKPACKKGRPSKKASSGAPESNPDEEPPVTPKPKTKGKAKAQSKPSTGEKRKQANDEPEKPASPSGSSEKGKQKAGGRKRGRMSRSDPGVEEIHQDCARNPERIQVVAELLEAAKNGTLPTKETRDDTVPSFEHWNLSVYWPPRCGVGILRRCPTGWTYLTSFSSNNKEDLTIMMRCATLYVRPLKRKQCS